MTSELERLFRAGEYQRCRTWGQRMLKAGALTAAERFRILILVSRCRQAAGGGAPPYRHQCGRLRLISAGVHRAAGRIERAVAEAFQALQQADPLSPLQVRAQLCLSRLAEATGRQVEALAFALAARVSAAAGGLWPLERTAAHLLAGQVSRGGWTALSELADALTEQGIDLYQYLDPAEVISAAE